MKSAKANQTHESQVRRPSASRCRSPGPGFMFGLLMFDDHIRPGLDFIFLEANVKRPVALLVDGDGSLVVSWESGDSNDLGCMHQSMVLAVRAHYSMSIAVGVLDGEPDFETVLHVETVPIIKARSVMASVLDDQSWEENDAKWYCHEHRQQNFDSTIHSGIVRHEGGRPIYL